MSKTPDADQPLLAAAVTGDFSAFETLVSKYERRVFGLARRVLNHREDAEEAVQQTFMKVVEHLGEFREESTFYTWLMRIATNEALALLRRRAVRRMESLDEPAGESFADAPHPRYIAVWRETPADLAQRNETRRAVDAALAELDEKYRLVFILRDIQGFSTEETARTLGITESNAKVRLLRARLMLREKLTAMFGDESTAVAPHDHDETSNQST